jgi:PAS domain S-box-containing protein
MAINAATAEHMVEAAATAAKSGGLAKALDPLPAAIYVADPEGTITYYNPACVALAGRVPELGRDKWCVTWKIYSNEGEFVPHDECPMAVAIREKRPVRGVEAVAERPDGSRIHFEPYPTPLYDEAGRFAGAVNLLLDVTEQKRPDFLNAQAERCRRLAFAVDDAALAGTLGLMAEKYEAQALKATRR